MTALISNKARAYVNHGRWIAECPYECGSAVVLQPGEAAFHCSECLSISPVEWPLNAQDIWDALAERRLPRTRNWFPPSHDLALRAGLPHGQTPDELRTEQKDHEEG